LQFRIKSRHRGATKRELPPEKLEELDSGLVRGGAAGLGAAGGGWRGSNPARSV